MNEILTTSTARHSVGDAASLAQLSEICLKTTGLVSVADRSGDTQRGCRVKTYCKSLTIDRAHVHAAFDAWALSQAGRKNAPRVIEEHGSAEALIDEIASEISRRALTFRPIRRYERREPSNGKVRLIGVESVKQQVCDYVAVTALEPLLAAKVGHYQVASVKGKGQLYTARSIRRWASDGGYWVKVDVRKCYPSIRHEIVTGILKRYVRSDDVLYLTATLLGTYGRGLDIGSYFSLRMAQLVLSFGYHHLESLGTARRGKRRSLISHQLWYMDDVLLMSASKRDLRVATRSLEKYLSSTLGLDLKPWKICRVGDDEPIDMAGFVARPDRLTIRSSIFLRARRAFLQFDRRPTLTAARRVCSYWGWITHTDSRSFMNSSDALAIKNRAAALISELEASA